MRMKVLGVSVGTLAVLGVIGYVLFRVWQKRKHASTVEIIPGV